MKQETIDILFLGDIVGRPGRRIVAKFLEQLNNDAENSDFLKQYGFSKKPDFIIANVENASHGFGLTEKNYNNLVNFGIGALTSGNHIWDKKEIFGYIDKADKLIRPFNYPKGVPGLGSRIFDVNGISIGVISLLGRVFMTPVDSPWEALDNEVKRIKDQAYIIIVDFHAEATAEKLSFGYFADRLGVSAVIGTHTHIQTADERIFENGTGYITDVGYCGASHSIIGMDINNSVKRLVTSMPDRYEVALEDKAEINGVRLLINSGNGCTEKIERIKYFSEVGEVN